MFGIQFYPTPKSLSDKMLSKIDFSKVKSILEPSAGKGDLCDAVKAYKIKCFEKEYGEGTAKGNVLLLIDCVEIDKSLRDVLKGKNLNVVGNDFLEYTTYTQYDLIIMNPPFADGDKHLLKAIEMSKNGGQICCILNAETLKNPYSVYRQDLLTQLEKYDADIEYVSDAFTNADRTTDVEVAIVYIKIPQVKYSFDYFNNLMAGEEFQNIYDQFNNSQLATNDTIANILRQYNDECRLGLTLIDTYEKLESLIPTETKNNSSLISLSVMSSEIEIEKLSNLSKKNKYIRELRYKYWTILFQTKEMSNLFTDSVRNKFRAKVEELRNYDFTFHNIKTLQIELSQNLSDNIEEAILDKFEELTYKHSLDCSKNIHYYNGWQTNDAYAINKKVIIPCYGMYDSRYGWSLYKVHDFLEELEKIFTYLDAGRTEGEDAHSIIHKAVYTRQYNGERLNFKYFDCEFKKKCTIHLWFTNLDLLKKFNIFGANKKGWLPKGYGKKNYTEMTKEDQSVVDSFEGKRSYEEAVNNSQFYLSLTGNSMNDILMIESGK